MSPVNDFLICCFDILRKCRAVFGIAPFEFRLRVKDGRSRSGFVSSSMSESILFS